MFTSKGWSSALSLFIVTQPVVACQALNVRPLTDNPIFGAKPQSPRDLEPNRAFPNSALADNSQFSSQFNSQLNRPDTEFAGRPLLAKPTYFKQINSSTWRTRVGANVLYPLIIRHLSESYILKSSDNRALSVQTDWDKFFIGGRLFRNRLSVSLFQLSPADTELVVNNKVEYFQQSEETAAYGESDWIPTQDITNEKSGLIEGLSKILHAINLSAAAGRPF